MPLVSYVKTKKMFLINCVAICNNWWLSKEYRNDSKLSYVWFNSADPDQTALHCVPFHL